MHRIRIAIALLVSPLLVAACTSDSTSGSAAGLCQTLEDLRLGRIDVEHEDPNEFVGHVRGLEALIEAAPGAVRADLEFVRDKLEGARDAGGWTTLLDFASHQDPEIGNAEGRVTEYVARECGVQYVETNNFPTLRDVDLKPDLGSENPWRQPTTKGAERRYTAQLVNSPAPAESETNTVYVGEAVEGGINPAVFLIYRIYAADQGALPPNSAGVKLPAVTIYDQDGVVTERFEARGWQGCFEVASKLKS